jgi:cation diffusion facilitator family transporter
MTNDIAKAEKKVFKITSTGTVINSIIGFIIFFITSSQAILVDSFFSLFGAFIAFISIWVVTISSSKANDQFPYGLTQAKPMLELFKAIALLGFVIITIINGISSILKGGFVLPGEIIVIYALVSIVLSIFQIIWIMLIGRKFKSSLIKLEIIQILQDISITIGIGIVFGLTMVFDHQILKFILPYLDSILVIIIGLLFTPSIIKIILSSGKQLLLGSPSQEVKKVINEIVLKVCKENNLSVKACYTIYSGGLLIIDTELFYIDETWNWNKVENIRNVMEERIKSEYSSSETFVSFYRYENPRHLTTAST